MIDPAGSTAGNFMQAVPFTLLMMLCLPSQVSFDNPGMWYALAAGALASASGYVIWYMVVVRFTVTVAAVVQLSVPVITAIGGVLFVNEPITLRVALSSAAILGGIFFATAFRRG